MSLREAVARSLNAYAAGVGRLPDAVDAIDESNHVARCERLVTELVEAHSALLVRRTATSLIFDAELTAALAADDDLVETRDRRRAIARAYFYACLEMAAPDSRTFQQSNKLGHALLELTRDLRSVGLREHAKATAIRAEETFRSVALSREADEATYVRRLLDLQTGRRGLTAVGGRAAWALAGFGYRPYWLLAWAAGLIVLTSVALGLAGVELPVDALRISCMAYVGGVGLEDVDRLNGASQVFVIAESLVALVLNTVLLALLARRWFRF